METLQITFARMLRPALPINLFFPLILLDLMVHLSIGDQNRLQLKWVRNQIENGNKNKLFI